MVLQNWFIVVFCVCGCYGLTEVFMDREWDDFKRLHNKHYSQQQDIKRESIWRQNIDFINKHNIEADLGHHTYRLGMNAYGDMTNDEFTAIIKCVHEEVSLQVNGSTFLSPNNMKLPEAVDWREKGYVTGVKDQGRCGSCWAFSATGALEGQNFRKTGKLISLSEQNLIDCSKENYGCDGGNAKRAYDYIRKNGGIDTEKSYPYLGTDGNACQYKQSNVGATCQGYKWIPFGDEQLLQKAVANVGPISVAIDSSDYGFRFYKSGVYYSSTCSSTNLNHAVLVIGYGVDQTKDYWLVKNSWGTTWGMNGYIKMSRNQDNHCGIASSAIYPIVDLPTPASGVYSSTRVHGVTYTFLILAFFRL